MTGLIKSGWRWRGALVTAVVTAAFIILIWQGERHFSSTGFCTSCHAMSYPYEELRRGPHYSALGFEPGCGDCHLPPGLAARTWTHVASGAKDTYAAATKDFSTQEKFDERRAELVRKAREDLRKWKGSPCRACHRNPRPESPFGKAAHEKLDAGDLTCVDCRRGIFCVREGGA